VSIIAFFKGKGHAEMAVSRCRTIQSGITTPESIPSTPMSSSFDEDSVCDIIFPPKKNKLILFSSTVESTSCT